jgi:hypothetical protein
MKKPKLPSRILIGNVAYDIAELPQDRIDAGVNGDCSNVLNHTIRIDPNLVGHDAIETVLHEVLHAMEDVYRIKLSHKQVYQLSNALAAMVRYNPHITNWMEKIENYSETLNEAAE